jgi:hypothetical protein
MANYAQCMFILLICFFHHVSGMEQNQTHSGSHQRSEWQTLCSQEEKIVVGKLLGSYLSHTQRNNTDIKAYFENLKTHTVVLVQKSLLTSKNEKIRSFKIQKLVRHFVAAQEKKRFILIEDINPKKALELLFGLELRCRFEQETCDKKTTTMLYEGWLLIEKYNKKQSDAIRKQKKEIKVLSKKQEQHEKTIKDLQKLVTELQESIKESKSGKEEI